MQADAPVHRSQADDPARRGNDLRRIARPANEGSRHPTGQLARCPCHPTRTGRAIRAKATARWNANPSSLPAKSDPAHRHRNQRLCRARRRGLPAAEASAPRTGAEHPAGERRYDRRARRPPMRPGSLHGCARMRRQPTSPLELVAVLRPATRPWQTAQTARAVARRGLRRTASQACRKRRRRNSHSPPNKMPMST